MQVVELGGSRNDEVAHEGVGVGAVLGVGEDHLRNGKLKTNQRNASEAMAQESSNKTASDHT